MGNDEDASLGDQNTFSGSRRPQDESSQSLGDEHTFSGGVQNDPKSLGDEATFGGAAGNDEPFDDDMEVIDLSARYTVEGTLGKGGMGQVLLATDTRLERKVAIKRILGDAVKSRTAVSRFLTEAKSIATLNHPNIVQVYDYGRAADGPFLIMEYVEGSNLLEKCREGALPLEVAVELTCQLCDALRLVHERGIVHRDIKPANILMTTDGIPKLTDFGLARREASNFGQTRTGTVIGTLDFMSPEQRKDAALTDARSDLWSLAATLYQLLTGELPRVIDLDAVPRQLRRTLATALKSQKEKRYQSAAEFRDALQASLKDSGPEPMRDVDLGAGECARCHTRNESSRKFCRECAGPLRVSCLSCENDIPVWEKVCGECGGKQLELVAARRAEMEAQREDAESLRAEYRYDEALEIAQQLADEPDPRLQHLSEWSRSIIESTASEKQSQQNHAASQFAESLRHQTAYDYTSAVHALEAIPEIFRTSEMSELLQRVDSDERESQELLKTIDARVQRDDLDGLLEQVTRAVELRGDRKDLQKLKTQLADRQAKLIRRRNEVFAEAGKLLQRGEAEEALAIIGNVEKVELRSTDLNEIVQAEDSLAAMLTEAKEYGVVEPEDVLSLLAAADHYLSLNPGHEKISCLRRSLIGKIRKAPDRYGEIPLWLALTLSAGVLAEIPRVKTKSLTLKGHTRNVTSVAFSPDGRRIISGSAAESPNISGEIKVWDAESGQETLTLNGHTERVRSVVFSPDGRRIVSGSFDKTLKVWDAESGAETLTLKGHPGSVTSVAFSPDGRRIISGSAAQFPNISSEIRVWDAADGSELLTLAGNIDDVTSVAFSPDGGRIIGGSGDRTIKEWDAKTGQDALTLKGHTGTVTSVAFSPDGRRIISGSADCTVKVWDANTGQDRLTLIGHTGNVTSVAFSPNGGWIISGSGDRTIKVWHAKTGQEALTLKGHTGTVTSVAFSPDGRRIVSGSADLKLKVWGTR
jgi:WD40 repeat protein/serine/threonine protein kinase